MYIYIHIYMNLHTYIHDRRVHVCVCVCMCVCVYTCVCVCVHVCAHYMAPTHNVCRQHFGARACVSSWACACVCVHMRVCTQYHMSTICIFYDIVCTLTISEPKETSENTISYVHNMHFLMFLVVLSDILPISFVTYSSWHIESTTHIAYLLWILPISSICHEREMKEKGDRQYRAAQRGKERWRTSVTNTSICHELSHHLSGERR